MSKIGKFLNLKGFHPSNFRNQERVWKKEQEQKLIQKRENERQKELRKEHDIMEFNKLQRQTTGKDGSLADSVSFLYAAPPGMKKENDEEDNAAEDDAVRDFKRTIAAKKLESQKKNPNVSKRANQTALERIVGKPIDKGLTVAEHLERFPQLAGAPVEGDWAKEVKVAFKPFNAQIRNVKCLRCHQWGHQSGDRECEMKDANPNDDERRFREDPLTLIKQESLSGKKTLMIKQSSLPREFSAGWNKGDIVLSSSDDEALQTEKEYLSNLTKDEKKALLQHIKKMDQAKSSPTSGNTSSENEESRKQKKKKSKSKKRKKKHKKESERKKRKK